MIGSTNSVDVMVKEAAREDEDRGIARVSMDAMGALGLLTGDVIEIEGKQTTCAIVWPGFARDTGRAVIRIGGCTRGNAGAAVDEHVLIRKVRASDARRVIIRPTQPIKLSGREQHRLRLLLIGRSVMAGQALRVGRSVDPLTVMIAEVIPDGIVTVSGETEVELKEAQTGPKSGKVTTAPRPLVCQPCLKR
jgi:transitional endoplasmic reticulum ATPase